MVRYLPLYRSNQTSVLRCTYIGYELGGQMCKYIQEQRPKKKKKRPLVEIALLKVKGMFAFIYIGFLEIHGKMEEY